MSFDDDFVDRNDNTLVENEISKSNQTVNRGKVAGGVVILFKILGCFFMAITITGILTLILNKYGIGSGSLIHGIVTFAIMYFSYRFYKFIR